MVELLKRFEKAFIGFIEFVEFIGLADKTPVSGSILTQ
jgi:hypothetical protein